MRSRAINAKARQKKAAVMTYDLPLLECLAVMTYRCWSVCPHRFG
ncbi:hypothetical protein LTSERUB_1495 [Salmonella enterica subsp. enterica serovar Rubislaw str. A4-653]|uniref:Uncharacterized protein n=1 Tax=Salmonella enterica subsp. enterica serovar Rubislaw str. A4-653 TaxID=913081 RepID=G5QGG0_SALRU|nr:hypothetical protein LTSERUB_1495 [Salmonella enterica subsp. enterica serovar Rubislaw str. A4-653]